MEMYPVNDLYEIYKKNTIEDNLYSSRITDITKKRTLEVMNLAINCCESWGTSLDIGGNRGHYSIPLIHKFKKSVLVEVDNYKEHKDLKNKYLNFEYYNNFIEQIEFKEKFDFILLADIFEHIPDIDNFVEKISNLQSVGGVVYILTPNPLFCGPAEQSGIYYKITNKDGHIKHYLPSEIKKIMGVKNYEAVHIIYEEGPLRQEVRRIIKGFSRRERFLCNRFYIFKKLISPLLSILYSPILNFLEYYVYKEELRYKNDMENTRAVAYIFKKTL